MSVSVPCQLLWRKANDAATDRSTQSKYELHLFKKKMLFSLASN